MQHRDLIILRKVIDEIEIADQMMGCTKIEAFLDDEKLKRAISMTIINIGELIKNITDEMRNKHSEVPWKEVAGMRDITAHKYQTLRMEDVYNTVKWDLPVLKDQLERIMKEDQSADWIQPKV